MNTGLDKSLANRTALVVGGGSPPMSTLAEAIERELAGAGARCLGARSAAVGPAEASARADARDGSLGPSAGAADSAPDVDHGASSDGAWRAAGLDAPVGAEALFDHAVQQLGQVDILVVLGAAQGAPGTIAAPRAQDGATIRAAGILCAAFIRHLVPGRPGRILLVSPVPPEGADAAGAVASAADDGRSRTGGLLDPLAASLAPAVAAIGITVNAIDPADRPQGWLGGYLRRRLEPALPSGALEGPGDVARVVCFLASDDGAAISGQVIRGAGAPS